MARSHPSSQAGAAPRPADWAEGGGMYVRYFEIWGFKHRLISSLV